MGLNCSIQVFNTHSEREKKMALYKVLEMSICFSSDRKRFLYLKYISVMYLLEGNRRITLKYLHTDAAIRLISRLPLYVSLTVDLFQTLKPGENINMSCPVTFYWKK